MERIKSVCTLCPCCCGLTVFKEGDRITKITGDPDSPLSKGHVCKKGRKVMEYVNHPERVIYPMRKRERKRVDEWERISWDDAFEIIASNVNRIKDQYGPESVLFIRGAARGIADILFTRLANAFGSPNITSMAFLCFLPRLYAHNFTFGSFLYPDYDHPPKCLVLWGINPRSTFPPIYEKIRDLKKKGTKVILVDPRRSETSHLADFLIRPKPSSDIFLILSMIHEIIKHGLYDEQFVERWTYGFEALKEHVKGFDPGSTEKYTWVRPQDVREFVRIYTENRPAAIQEGNGIEQSLTNFQTIRALNILEAITGNIGIPGGKIKWIYPRVVDRRSDTEFTLQNMIPKDVRERRIGAKLLSPFVFYALPQEIVRSLTSGDDAPKAAFIMGGNVVLTWPDSKRTFEALSRLDFIFTADLFLTPTTRLADVFLPVLTHLEFDSVCVSSDFPYFVAYQRKIMEPRGEAKSDLWIINQLGRHLGLKDYFFENEKDILDAFLSGERISFEEFKGIGMLLGTKEYRFYEKNGFHTDSGKVEIYSSKLEKFGVAPLPSPGNSEVFEDDRFPYILSSYKPGPFRHTNLRQVKSLREGHPEPRVCISIETARNLRVKAGDQILVETERGRILARVKVMRGIDPRLVFAEHGWWYPETGWESFFDLNLNVLTSSDPPFGAELGTPRLRGLPCDLKRA